jgi:hypothetical protein
VNSCGEIAVGAHRDDEMGEDAGAVYLKFLDNVNQAEKIFASDATPGDWFGLSVSSGGVSLVVGAPAAHL